MFKYLSLAASLFLAACDHNRPAHVAQSQEVPKRTYSAVQQTKVLADIDFGISKKQFNKLYKRFLKTKGCDGGCSLGKFNYYKEFTQFRENKLYYVELANYGVKYDSYDETLPGTLNDAYQVVKLEYGEPDVSHPLPDWSSVQNFTNHLLKRWIVGTKMIDISLSRINEQYGIAIEIYQPAVRAVADQEAAKADSLKEDSLNKKDRGTL